MYKLNFYWNIALQELSFVELWVLNISNFSLSSCFKYLKAREEINVKV